MFGFSFLTTLNIYKDCFKGRHSWCTLMQKFFTSILWIEDICPNLSFSSRSCCVCTPQGFITTKLHDLHCIDELKNFATNILLKLVCKLRIGIHALNWLVIYWEPCIEIRGCHYRISPIGYWGKGSTIGWYKVLRFLYL